MGRVWMTSYSAFMFNTWISRQTGITLRIMRITRALLVPALAAVALIAFAQSGVLGTWKGKVTVNVAKLPKVDGKEGQKMIEQMKAMLSKMTMTLVMKPNKTFTVTVSNLPGKAANQSAGGNWTQAGTKVTLTTTTENGKPAKKKEVQTLMLSADGKKMNMNIPEANGAASVTFTR